jgi:hypothetical protein
MVVGQLTIIAAENTATAYGLERPANQAAGRVQYVTKFRKDALWVNNASRSLSCGRVRARKRSTARQVPGQETPRTARRHLGRTTDCCLLQFSALRHCRCEAPAAQEYLSERCTPVSATPQLRNRLSIQEFCSR